MEQAENTTNCAAGERILDVRPEPAFRKRHRVGAVNIPLEELIARLHELPPPHTRLLIFDDNPVRARWARSRLRSRGRTNVETAGGEAWLAAGETSSGPAQDRLWSPHSLLAEAVEIARRIWGSIQGKKALDIACGSGRDAVFLALEGFDVEAWDVLPDALARCDDLASRCGTRVRAVLRDVEKQPSIPAASFDLICCFNYLHRPLLPIIAAAVRPGGLIVYETFLEQQRELFDKPWRDAHLLKAAELRECFGAWKIHVYREGLTGPRRCAASLIGEKPV